jgi:micrococcal nuclease
MLKRSLIVLFLLLIFPIAGCEAGEGMPILLSQGASQARTPAVATDDEIETVVDAQVGLSTFLYSGPGREYEQAGSAFPGMAIQVIGRNQAGNWYQIADGRWISSVAVRGRPDVPVVGGVRGRIPAELIQVLDGDSIEVRYGGQSYQIRYLMSNTPQDRQALSEEATEMNQLLLAGQTTVYLEQDLSDRDVYNRHLRYVFLDNDIMINEEMVRSGYAQVAAFEPDFRYEERLRAAQREARAARRGIWSQDALAFQGPAFREEPEGCLYTIQRGDTAVVVARRFGLTPQAIAAANGITNINRLEEGVELRLPGCKSVVETEVVVVAGGADLESAAVDRAAVEVIQVLGGNSIEVRHGDQTYQIRYLLSNTPQDRQPLGEEATGQNRELVEGQTVYLEQDVTNRDVYNRFLRYVFLEDGTLVNEEMVRSGYAQVATFPPDLRYEDRLRAAQAEAQAAGRGVWAEETPAFREDATGCIYTIQRGDTLLIVARRFGLTIADIANVNGITNINVLRVGDELLLPGCKTEDE